MDVNTNKKFCLKVHDKTQNMMDQKNIYLLLFSINKIKKYIPKKENKIARMSGLYVNIHQLDV